MVNIADVTEKPELSKLLDLVHSKCSDAFRSFLRGGTVLYRGHVVSTDKCGFEIRPQDYKRKSKYTANYYTVLLSQLPSFANYPPRDKSLICTTDFEIANGFARDLDENLYVVFPVNGTKIGIANAPDLWLVRDKSLWYFSEKMERYFGGVCLDTYEKQLALEKFNNTGTVYKKAVETWNPELFGFELKTTSQLYNNSVSQNTEVWFSNNAYMIRYNSLEKYRR